MVKVPETGEKRVMTTNLRSPGLIGPADIKKQLLRRPVLDCIVYTKGEK